MSDTRDERRALQLRAQAVDALSRLPGHPDEIALYLQERGHKGRRNSPAACPINRYLSHMLEVTCLSGPRYAIIQPSGIAVHVDFPPAVVDFIANFDDRKYLYSDLIEG